MPPKISIITINFNNKEGLERTILSVISQNFKDFEYIVIDGGSTDGSKEIIEKHNNQISYWISEPDKGIYNAMNKGIAATKGEYLLFLNSGDHFCEENSLETGVSYLGKEEIIYGNLKIVDAQHTFTKQYKKKLTLYYFFHESLPHPATFIKKTTFNKIGFYDETLSIVSDWKWFLEAIISYNCTYKHIDETISTFYLDGLSSAQENINKIQSETITTFKKLYPQVLEDFSKMKKLEDENRILKESERKFEFLKKYRIVKMLNYFGLIKIP